jgi:probable HAF family extracellular repeat protein
MRQLQYAAYAILLTLTSTIVAAAQRFSVTTIPMPSNAIDMFAYGINQLGVVAGGVDLASGGCAFIYDQIHAPQVICSFVNGQPGDAFGINDFRQIAGSSDSRGFVYSHSKVSVAGLLPNGTFSGLLSINNFAQATGQADTGPPFGNGGIGLSHAILFSASDGKLIDLGVLPGGEQTYGIAINNLGQVTGFGDVPIHSGIYGATEHAFLYSNGEMMDIGGQPGWFSSQTVGINDFSQVLGFFATPEFVYHTFIYKDGKAQDLGTQIFPSALNNFADIVGTDNIVSPYGSVSAALYSDGVMQDLNTLVPAATPFYIESALGINDSGQIIGAGVTADGSSPAFILTPICDRRQYKISQSDLEKNEHWCLAAKGIRIVPPAAAFGDVEIGTTSQSITVTVTNTSGEPIRFHPKHEMRKFKFDAGTCRLKDGKMDLDSGASCAFSVSFSPERAGVDEGRIKLDTSVGPVDYRLSGTGTE